jgi:hypothetical protein
MTLRQKASLAGLLPEFSFMKIEKLHVRTADTLTKLVAQLEGLRDDIAEVLRRDLEGGARDRIVCELANIAHELGKAQNATRD